MVVETVGLTKVYPGGGGCRDITLSVGEGEIFGLLGPNGAGKSTLVKILVGLIFPTGGHARVLGRPLGDLRAREKVGFLPENFRYHQWLTAGELLRFHGALGGMAPADLKRRIPQVLDLARLTGVERRKVGTFSKGMQQRLGLAVALLAGPQLLFLDEPTSALDPVGRREVRRLLLDLKGEGVTVFLNSHLLSEVERVCDRVAVIKEGRLVAQGGLAELLDAGPEVEIEVDEIDEDLLEVLRPLVRDLRREGTALLARVARRQEVPLLARRIVESGRSLYALRPRRTSLEDLFVELMEGDDTGAGEAVYYGPAESGRDPA
ncbi:MAG: ABC transporter ATP-binding protein [Firmicutes bacterium]|nr:ABC transporter ATP-binding protein [Bacillota bacterium]